MVRYKVWSTALDGSETHEMGTEVFGEFRNVVLEENGEDKMIRVSK